MGWIELTAKPRRPRRTVTQPVAATQDDRVVVYAHLAVMEMLLAFSS